MAVIPTPEQGKPILDFSAGTFDGNSNLFQSRNGATEHVNGDDVADYVNTSRIYNGLETSSKTPVGAINEINNKNIGDINDVNLSSPADGDAFIYDAASGKWVNKSLKGEAITFTPEAGVTINALSSWKTDRLCGISFDIKGIETTAGTMTTIGTVDILPSAVVRTGITNVGSGSHVGIARVNVQGTVGIMTESALSSSSSISFSFIYKSRT